MIDLGDVERDGEGKVGDLQSSPMSSMSSWGAYFPPYSNFNMSMWNPTCMLLAKELVTCCINGALSVQPNGTSPVSFDIFVSLRYVRTFNPNGPLPLL